MYSDLPVIDNPNGRTAKIAVCKSFKEAHNAYENGYHAAIVTNAQTKRWEKTVAYIAYSMRYSSGLAIPITAIMSLGLAFAQKNALKKVGFDTSKTVCNSRMFDQHPAVRVHSDTNLADYIGIASSYPKTTIYSDLPSEGYLSAGKAYFEPKPRSAIDVPKNAYLLMFKWQSGTIWHRGPFNYEGKAFTRGFHYVIK